MSKHNKSTLAAMVLLAAALSLGSCHKDKQPSATVTPSSLTLLQNETKNVSVEYKDITVYRFEIEDTTIAEFVFNNSTSGEPSDGSSISGSTNVGIKGLQIGETNLRFICPNEGFEKKIPIEVVDNE